MKKGNKCFGNKFCLEGLNVERFINHLVESNITVYNLKKTEFNKLEFTTNVKDSIKVEKLAESFNFKIVHGYKGVYSLLNFLKNRIGIIIGLILAFILTIIVNQFTFNFSILGLENIEESRVEEVLKKCGIEKFKINEFDSKVLETCLASEISEISMVSVVKKGTTIIINIKEKLPSLEAAYQPIVAEYNMLITGLEVYAGFTNLKVGDSIFKGDTIIFPYSFDGDNNPIPCEPKAKITALTWFTASQIFVGNEIRLVRTGNKQIYDSAYNLGKNEILKTEKEIDFEKYEVEETNDLISYLFLPIGVDKKVAYELEEIEIKHNFEEEKDGLINNCLKTAYEKVPLNILIEDEKVVLSNDEDRIIISVYLQASIVLGES